MCAWSKPIATATARRGIAPSSISVAGNSEERLAYERAQRIKAMDRVRTRLEKLQRRIVDGRLKAAEKVGAAATRVLARNHGHRYYDWSYDDGVFLLFEHPVHFAREADYAA